jgi:parvulin-like peptidyl-prolyl isomerase
MSIMGMRRKFAQHLKVIMWIIVGVFVVGIPLGVFYSNRMPNDGGPKRAGEQDQSEVIAQVGKTQITRARFEAAYNETLDRIFNGSGQKISILQVLAIRNQALAQLASDVALENAAQEAGITLSRGEIDQSLDQESRNFIGQIKETAARQGRDPREFYRGFMEKQGVSRSRVSEDEFLDWLKNQYLASNKASVESGLLLKKFQKSIMAPVQVSDADLQASFDQAKSRIILISRKNGKLTEAEVKKKAEEIYANLQKGADFTAQEKSSSDAGSGGEMFSQRWISRSDIRRDLGEEAEKTLFGLAPNQYTAPIKVPVGYVLLQLLEKRNQPPADLAKKMDTYRKQLLASRQQEVWGKIVEDAQKKMPLTSKTPDIVALQAIQEGNAAAAKKAFESVVNNTPTTVPGEVYCAICVQLAQSAFESKDFPKAQELLNAALGPPQEINRERISGYPEAIYLLSGKLYLEQKDKAKALENFDQADNNAAENPMVHAELARIYQQMGEAERAKAQQQWLQEYAKNMQPMRQPAPPPAKPKEQKEQKPKSPAPAPSGK